MTVGDTPRLQSDLALRVVRVLGIGLGSGIGLVLPMLVMVRVPVGGDRTAWLLMALLAAILLIRRLRRILYRLLDSTEQPHRFPLLAVYAVAAMLPPVSLLLLPRALQ